MTFVQLSDQRNFAYWDINNIYMARKNSHAEFIIIALK